VRGDTGSERVVGKLGATERGLLHQATLGDQDGVRELVSRWLGSMRSLVIGEAQVR